MQKELLFYIPSEDDEQGVAGPYDLVQLAALLRKGQISSETLTFREGEAEWKPFADRPQFIVAREMPSTAVSNRQIALEEAAAAGKSVIPLPSREQLVQFAVTVILFLVGGAIVYAVARADAVTGLCLLVLSSCAALLAQVLIYCQILDEDWMTICLIAFIPFYDLYYFTTNIYKYLPYFLAKYGGSLFAAAAYAGLASVASRQSENIQSALHLIGL